jgi:hypothetical protein
MKTMNNMKLTKIWHLANIKPQRGVEFLKILLNPVQISKSPKEKRESCYRLTDCHSSLRRQRQKNRYSARRQLKEADSSLWRLCNSSWRMTLMTWSKVWAASCRKWATPAVSKTQSSADLTCGRWCQEAWRMSSPFSTESFKRICNHRYKGISFWKTRGFLKWITKRELSTKKIHNPTSEKTKWAVKTCMNRIPTTIVSIRQLKKHWDSEASRRSAPTVIAVKRKLNNRSL